MLLSAACPYPVFGALQSHYGIDLRHSRGTIVKENQNKTQDSNAVKCCKFKTGIFLLRAVSAADSRHGSSDQIGRTRSNATDEHGLQGPSHNRHSGEPCLDPTEKQQCKQRDHN